MPKLRILVVDDLPDVRATLAGILEDEGYEVVTAPSREEALEKARRDAFDVAVLDVRLDDDDASNRDGLLLMHDLRALAPQIAIIILTGYGDIDIVREALQPDATGYAPAYAFLKKSEMLELPACISRVLQQVHMREADEIAELIQRGEGQTVEFKASLRWDWVNRRTDRALGFAVARAVAGMLNSATPGYVLIGVADDGSVPGIAADLRTLKKANLDGFQLVLTDILRDTLGSESIPYVHPRFVEIEAATVCVIQTDPSPQPIFARDGNEHKFLIRMGNSTRALDPKETTDYILSRWGSSKR